MADREADKMTLWQRSQEEASSHARGRDRGKDKQMLFITHGWWGFNSVGALLARYWMSHKVEVLHGSI